MSSPHPQPASSYRAPGLTCVEASVQDDGPMGCSGPPGSGWPHSPTRPPTQTRAPRSCPLHPPKGLQQDAELLSAAQRKHGDQHLQWGKAGVGGGLATCSPRWRSCEHGGWAAAPCGHLPGQLFESSLLAVPMPEATPTERSWPGIPESWRPPCILPSHSCLQPLSIPKGPWWTLWPAPWRD